LGGCNEPATARKGVIPVQRPPPWNNLNFEVKKIWPRGDRSKTEMSPEKKEGPGGKRAQKWDE